MRRKLSGGKMLFALLAVAAAAAWAVGAALLAAGAAGLAEYPLYLGTGLTAVLMAGLTAPMARQAQDTPIICRPALFDQRPRQRKGRR